MGKGQGLDLGNAFSQKRIQSSPFTACHSLKTGTDFLPVNGIDMSEGKNTEDNQGGQGKQEKGEEHAPEKATISGGMIRGHRQNSRVKGYDLCL